MRMKVLTSAMILAGLLAGSAALAAENQPKPLPGLTYYPEGDAIVIRNGTRWDNRPLYCNQRMLVILAGEMPRLSSPGWARCTAGVVRGDVRVQLHEFGLRVMRYRPGRIEWELTDPRFPGLTITMTATTAPEGDGFAVQIQSKGAVAGDELLWLYFPPEAHESPRTAAGHCRRFSPWAAGGNAQRRAHANPGD